MVYLNKVTAIDHMGGQPCFDPLLHHRLHHNPEPVLALHLGQVHVEILVPGGQGRHHLLRAGHGESGFKKIFSFSELTVARVLIWSCPYQSKVSPTGWGGGTALTRGELL